MKTRIPTPLRHRIRNGFILAAIPTILLLGSINPAWAKKGGNGNGGSGGGEEPPAVELVPAPVEYQITWLDWPEETTTFRLEDVNSSGHAVGWATPISTGKNIGIMADSAGYLWDLNEFFAEALQAFPGWRYNGAEHINANGDIAGILVPEEDAFTTDETIVVLGNIYASPRTLTVVEHFTNDAWADLPDLNESGDLLVQLRWPENAVYLYPSPDSVPNDRELVPAPADASAEIRHASLNGDGKVMYTAEVTSITTSTRGKKTTTTEERTHRSHLWDTDGALIDLGQVGGHFGDTPTLVSEDGNGYAGISLGDSSSAPRYPSRCSAVTETWEQVAPYGYVMALSKAEAGDELLMSGGLSPDLIYQRDYGTFAVEVTSGLNGQGDIDRFNEADSTGHVTESLAVSRPTSSGSGYISGRRSVFIDGRFYSSGFILTPIVP